MIGPFQKLSLQGKLFAFIAVNGSLGLLLVGLFLAGYEKVEARETARNELATRTRILVESSSTALEQRNRASTEAVLKSLDADPDIEVAAVYDYDGDLFASYVRPGAGRAPVRLAGTDTDDKADYLYSLSPVRLGGRMTGAVYLKSNMNQLNRHLRRHTEMVFLALVISLAAGLLVSARVQHAIAGPIGDLAEVARAVSANRDYSLRASRQSRDEVGLLVDSFNEMLGTIEASQLALRESEERYALAARGANDGLWDWKMTTGEIYFSPRWNQMLGYPEVETRQSPDDWFERIHPADRRRVRSEIAAHYQGRARELSTEYRIRRESGDYVWVLSRGIAVRDARGVPVRMAGSQTDITKGKVADTLTGLPNRLYFLDQLEKAIDACSGASEGGRRACPVVLFVDMERFKLINDSLGRAAGDAMLAEISARLRESLDTIRERTGADENSFVARLGGDQFGILLTGIRPEAASVSAECILSDFSRPFGFRDRQVFVAVSIGVAMASKGEAPDEILRNADIAMHHGRTLGKSRFELFDGAMRAQAVERLEIETELRNAIDAGEIVLHFQPQFELDSGRLSGFEALARWQNPVRGMVSPAEFIPVAEDTDLIVPLGERVLRDACRQMAQWQQSVPFDPPLGIAVNVSFRQLTRPEFVGKVEAILHETRLAPGCLSLELTESAVMEDPGESLGTLRRLKALGVRLEIDDFGTGYSSLSQLGNLPFDTLKIDRSFVTGLGTEQESVDLVRTILELARSWELDAVAEGVENETQLKKLKLLGCPRAQGYYFSRPLPEDRVPMLLEEEAIRRSFDLLERGDRNERRGESPVPADRAAPPLEAGAIR